MRLIPPLTGVALLALAACATGTTITTHPDGGGTTGGDGGTTGDGGTGALAAPTLQPVTGGTCLVDATFTWSEVAGASYVLEYGKQGDTPTSVNVAAGQTSYKVVGGLGPGTWTAHVKAKKGSDESAWSSDQTVTVAPGTAGSFSQTQASDFQGNTNTAVVVGTNGVTLGGSADGGDGSDGPFTASSNTTLPGGTHNFTTFTIASGVTVTVTGTTALTVKVQGAVSIAGTLSAAGPNGGNGVTFSTYGKGGVAVGGGSNGGDGVYVGSASPGNDGFGSGKGLKGTNWQGGSGAGYANAGGNSPTSSYGNGITGGASYGSADLSQLLGGSGGGGGSGGNSCGSGGGGAGGGVIVLSSSTSIDIASTGVVTVKGGNGGSDGGGNCGGAGGGSGGAVWLMAPTIDNQGSVTSTGGTGGTSASGTPGGVGSVGRIRVDGNTVTQGTMNPTPGFTGTLAFVSPGTTVTPVITPSSGTLCGWGKLDYVDDTSGNGTAVAVDVLDDKGAPLATGVATGTDLSTIPAVAAAAGIELRATLTTTDTANAPVFKSWTLAYSTK